MTDEIHAADEIAEEQAKYFDPDIFGIGDQTTVRLVQLVEEMQRMRAAARHWKARAEKAEPQAAKADELQRRLNEKLAEESAARLNGKAEKAEAKP